MKKFRKLCVIGLILYSALMNVVVLADTSKERNNDCSAIEYLSGLDLSKVKTIRFDDYEEPFIDEVETEKVVYSTPYQSVVKSQPDMESNSLWNISEGERIDVIAITAIDRNGDAWYKIINEKEQIGYIKKDYTQDTYVIKEDKNEKTVYSTPDLLIIREKPDVKTGRIMAVNEGTKLNVVADIIVIKEDCNEEWYKVKTSKGLGYVKREYVQDEPPMIYLGDFKITYYCACARCCGIETGITASGAHVQEGVTIAADSRFAFGTQLIIDDHTYTVQDRGGAIKGNRIDIYVSSHERALSIGTHTSSVYTYAQ